MNQAERISYPRIEALSVALAEAIAGAWNGVRATLDAYAQARGRAAAVRQLEQLSDRTLRDIGLHRSQVRAAVYGNTR